MSENWLRRVEQATERWERQAAEISVEDWQRAMTSAGSALDRLTPAERARLRRRVAIRAWTRQPLREAGTALCYRLGHWLGLDRDC